MLTRPEDIREVFRGDPAALHAGEGNALLSSPVGETPFSELRMQRPPGAASKLVRRGISIGPGDGARLTAQRRR